MLSIIFTYISHFPRAIFLSSWSSFSFFFILSYEKPFISSPSTILHSPFQSMLQGYEQQMLGSTPQWLSSGITPIETIPPCWFPYHQSWQCSQAAAAAEAAELFFMTEIISAPLLATFVINGPLRYASSLTTYLRGAPQMVAWKVSGYWVAL